MGKFAQVDDAVSRYEGTFPTDRMVWLATRIGDVENALMGLVPSLRKSVADITADGLAVGDPGRIDRVTSLVCDKVLDLFRNPERVTQETTTTPDVTIGRTYGGQARGSSMFTDADLESVRLRRRRSNFGTVHVLPQGPSRACGY